MHTKFRKNRLTGFKFVIQGHINTLVDIWVIDKYIHAHTQTYIHTYTHICIRTYIHKYIYIYIYIYIHTHTHTYIHKYRKVCDYTNLLSFFSAAQILECSFQKQASFLYFSSTSKTVFTNYHVSAKIKMNPRNLKLHCTAVSAVTGREESYYSLVHYSRQWPPEVSQCILKFTEHSLLHATFAVAM